MLIFFHVAIKSLSENNNIERDVTNSLDSKTIIETISATNRKLVLIDFILFDMYILYLIKS